MKKIKLYLAAIALFGAALFSSCGEDEPEPNNNGSNNPDDSEVIVSENITTNTTWNADKTYILAGRIAVLDGVELTIEAGTLIKGQAGSGANATALIIARGAKLFAKGTAEKPIIFTSIADEIEPGQIVSPNMDPTLNGLWGGVIILGKAPCSLKGNVTEEAIEGIPPTDPNGLYGGNVADDNSGEISYISIRHGGSNIGEGNEINGLTLGGVGSGTIIENVEVVANQDDGIEFFGGTVNVKNAIVWNAGDDGIDTDQAWAGTLDNFAVICGTETDHALEIDGPEGALNASHTLINGWVKGDDPTEDGRADMGDFRDDARGSFNNIYFFNFGSPAETGGFGVLSVNASQDNFDNGILTFDKLEVTLPANTELADVLKHGTDAHGTAVNAGANTVGANASLFGWTWTSKAGALN